MKYLLRPLKKCSEVARLIKGVSGVWHDSNHRKKSLPDLFPCRILFEHSLLVSAYYDINYYVSHLIGKKNYLASRHSNLCFFVIENNVKTRSL